MNRVELHKDICLKMTEIYKKKNSDYGGSVTQTYNKYGMVSFLVRMEDKLNRVKTLTVDNVEMKVDEKVEDTLIDLANYAILALIEFKATQALKCESVEEKEQF